MWILAVAKICYEEVREAFIIVLALLQICHIKQKRDPFTHFFEPLTS